MPVLELPGRAIDAELIVFDKDGVLLDFRHLWIAVTRARVAALCTLSGLPLEASLTTLLGIDASGQVAPGGLLAGGTRHESTLASATALHQAGLPWFEARQLAHDAYAAADQADDWANVARPLPGVVETIHALHHAGWKLGIATTDQTPSAQRFLERAGLAHCFSAVVGADQVARSKPAPDLFERACALAGVSPQRAVMVGDLDIDLLMGRAAGACANIGVLSGVGDTELLAPLADAVLPDITPLGG
ncbi:MAG: HAD family hydrolase [Candidatus Sericytochromatia bacterium]